MDSRLLVPATPALLAECSSCHESPDERCPKSQRPCGHHCNHSWSHDVCCWCAAEWGEDGEVAAVAREVLRG